tara:strand:- start:6420 stop:6557 length:138 start_codon:yes stop_codon:yes gene_type:complete
MILDDDQLRAFFIIAGANLVGIAMLSLGLVISFLIGLFRKKDKND